MPSLFNQQISATYKGLLKTTSNGILSSSLAQITDGNGNDSPLSMSTTEIQFNTGSNTFKFPTTRGTSGQILKLADANGTLDWVADASGDVTKTGTIALNTIAVWNDNADQLRSDTTMSINTNHTISLLQPNSVPTDVGSFNIGGGNIANVTGQNNTGFGSQNLNAVLEGSNNTAMGVSSLDSVTSGNSNTGFGSRVLTDLTIGDFNTAIGSSVLNDVSSGDNNTAVGYNAGVNVTTGSGNTYIGKSAGFSGTGSNNIYIGEGSGMSITSGDNNVIIGSNAGNYISGTSNNIIISDGSGNNRIQVDSGGNVGIGGTPPSITGYTALSINNATNGAILDLEQGDVMKARFIATSTTATIETGSGIPFAIDVNGNGSSDLSISSGGEATFKATTPSPVVSTPIVSIADSVNGVLGGIGALASGGYPLQIWGGTLELKTGSSSNIAAATTRLTISSGGNVAIGATGADSQFKVELKPAATILAGLRIGYNNTSQNYYDADEHFFRNGIGTNNHLAISSGGLATFSNGIKFAASTGIPSPPYHSGADTLDAYEEGTFTVALLATTTNPTTTGHNTTGYYTRVGNVVTVQYYSSQISVSNAGSGSVYFAGLPYQSKNTVYHTLAITHSTNFSSSTSSGFVGVGNSNFYPIQLGSTNYVNWQTGNTFIMFGGSYLI